MILSLLAGTAEFAAWIAGIYALASDAAGRTFFTVAAWADRQVREFEEKYGD